jgi:ABC-type phosphate transport system auxiliary subunit
LISAISANRHCVFARMALAKPRGADAALARASISLEERALGGGDFLALVGFDLYQDVGHGGPFKHSKRRRARQPLERSAAVERLGAERDAFLQILGLAGDDSAAAALISATSR